MPAITTSIFDLFKVGPGPSSSHTIGPMKAAQDFLERLHHLTATLKAGAAAIEVRLFGSLAATGKGHGTDRAVVAGLLGWKPETCDPDDFAALLTDPDRLYPIDLGGRTIGFGAAHLRFERGPHDFPFSNTMTMALLTADGAVLHAEEYYSVGGGFVQRKGEMPRVIPEPPYPYETMAELKIHLRNHGLSLPALIVRNEMALSDESERAVLARLDRVVDAMHRAVRRGLHTEGTLPGFIGLQRKAPAMVRSARALATTSDSYAVYLNAYCLAASEENAAGHMVVTAPTSGASGVIPGITYLLRAHRRLSRTRMREGMCAAAAIGFLVKHNASISGAEMGCMGEIGTASAMGAALLACTAGQSIEVIEAAAEIAIEHHLGMTCDPIGGYVQIPCIERNAMGAAKAYNAFLLAAAGNHAYQKISLDRVIGVMRATGRDMSRKYKETSEGGLALSATEC